MNLKRVFSVVKKKFVFEPVEHPVCPSQKQKDVPTDSMVLLFT